MSAGSMVGITTTTTTMEDGPQDFQPSKRFLGTLRSHSPSRRASSAISKTYKAASTLYLTRRLPEALQTIEPLISVPQNSTAELPTATTAEDDNDDEDAAHTTTTTTTTVTTATVPPIATANRSLRVKVWNFYLTLLNAIIELGPEEGKADFGGAAWRAMASKVRDGSVWEEVVQAGYGGREGSVDVDVVANLATLLLGQAPSQLLNQQRLETYLSLSSQPELVLADRLNGFEDAREDSLPQRRPSHHAASGANTPRDLNSRAKVLELYSLHVLPRNEEWDTSREFIRASNELDEERRDAFLYTLDTLQEQAQSERDHEKEQQQQELLRQRDEELARRRHEAEAKRLEESRLLDERSRASEAASVASSSRGVGFVGVEEGGGGGGGRRGSGRSDGGRGSISSLPGQQHHRSNSEVDYGIEDTRVKRQQPPLRKKESTSRALKGGGGGGGAASSSQTGASSSSSRLSRAKSRKAGTAPRTVLQRIPVLLRLLRKVMAGAVQTATKDPTTMLKYVLFLLAFLLALARRDVRERLGRITGFGWNKVRGTIGMGTKVSYI